MNASGTDFLRLAPFARDGAVRVVIESPRGARAKLKYEPSLRAFLYSRPLALGLAYPFDWGFIPSTTAQDGDPLDGFVIHDAPSFPGTVIPCRPLGVLEVEQTEGGKTERNDRLAFRPAVEPRQDGGGLLLSERVKQECEQFFLAATLGTGKDLNFLGWKDAACALALLKQSVRAFSDSDATRIA